jgi:hypothetical protein
MSHFSEVSLGTCTYSGETTTTSFNHNVTKLSIVASNYRALLRESRARVWSVVYGVDWVAKGLYLNTLVMSAPFFRSTNISIPSPAQLGRVTADENFHFDHQE